MSFFIFLFKSNKFEVAGKERLKAIKVKFTFWYLKKWVKNIFVAGGGVPNILHQVSVPVITNDLCQDMFKKSGHRKIIRFANRLIRPPPPHFILSILDSQRYHWNFYLISSPCFSILQLIIEFFNKWLAYFSPATWRKLLALKNVNIKKYYIFHIIEYKKILKVSL